MPSYVNGILTLSERSVRLIVHRRKSDDPVLPRRRPDRLDRLLFQRSSPQVIHIRLIKSLTYRKPYLNNKSTQNLKHTQKTYLLGVFVE